MGQELSTVLKELESNDFNVRKSAMGKLVTLGTNKATRELIGVANGRRIRLFGLLVAHPYDLEDQLAAIRFLAETGHPRARAYLKDLTECAITSIYDGANYGQGWSDVYSGFVANYHNLQGGLRKMARLDRSGDPIVRTGSASHFVNTPEHLPQCRETDIILHAQRRIEETMKQRQEREEQYASHGFGDSMTDWDYVAGDSLVDKEAIRKPEEK